jgi:hypothetical protein
LEDRRESPKSCSSGLAEFTWLAAVEVLPRDEDAPVIFSPASRSEVLAGETFGALFFLREK